MRGIRIFILACLPIILFLLPTFVATGKELGAAPNFQLTDQEGKTVKLSDFKGKVVVLDWIFTRCTDVCVMQTKRFKKLQDELKEKGLFGEKVVLLSITIDPKYDTPSVLKSYADKADADTSGWHFLTGDYLSIYKVARDYDFYVAKRFSAPEAERHDHSEYTFSHQEKTFIIDQRGMLVKVNEGESLAVSTVLNDIIELQQSNNS